MGSVTLTLPFSTTVVIQSFANAANMQRVTIQPESGQSLVFTGSGYYDTPIGQTTFRTPSSGRSPRGFGMTVSVDHSTNGGATWQPSQVAWVPCVVMYYNVYTVASEDSTDDTWDDATTYFTWTVPPPAGEQKIVRATAKTEESYQGRA
jgi:hypothetical protein